MSMELKKLLGKENFEKISRIGSSGLAGFLEKYLILCEPASVFVNTGKEEDIEYIRKRAIELGEEATLSISGHTIHFDNYSDQARDKKNTKILVPEGVSLGSGINTLDREKGLEEVHSFLKNIMKGKELIVSFYCLGPAGSPFSIPCVQLTDSFYVAHSENILYRQGYGEFLRQGEKVKFFKFVHSAGELIENNTSKNLDRRRIYIDLESETVYSVNTQYGGNTIGLKKLAMRLAINKSAPEGWLTEHMLVMGIKGKGEITYVTGAFPSLCGKTSTAMLEGETIVGDDIAYLRNIDGEVRAVNVEKGMFGIIQGINSKDDPPQWNLLNSPGEIIFSNILITEDKKTFWIDHDGSEPAVGFNHSGQWSPGKKDENGKEITSSHPNARFTVSLEGMKNVDGNLHNSRGVTVGGILYGGRDSDTSVPVEEAFNWVHGIVTKGASLESETTAATLGSVGVRVFNPMSNLDFLSVPVGQYIGANIEFGENLKKMPLIFGLNYFLKGKAGNFLNEKNDKKVWLKWIEKRIHGEVPALKRPTGFIPEYGVLKELFKKVLGKDYSKENYEEQFALRVDENIAKIERVLNIYSKMTDVPGILFEVLEYQKNRLEKTLAEFGGSVSPFVEIPF
ncbi:MAG: phosphoenolpyruvate carboxykinase (GTP) [bacterium]